MKKLIFAVLLMFSVAFSADEDCEGFLGKGFQNLSADTILKANSGTYEQEKTIIPFSIYGVTSWGEMYVSTEITSGENAGKIAYYGGGFPLNYAGKGYALTYTKTRGIAATTATTMTNAPRSSQLVVPQYAITFYCSSSIYNPYRCQSAPNETRKTPVTVYVSGLSDFVFKAACEKNQHFNMNIENCVTCPEGTFWDNSENQCTNDCSRVTSRNARMACLCEAGNLGQLKNYECFDEVVNCSGADCPPKFPFTNCRFQCENGSLSTNDLYKSAYKKYGLEKAYEYVTSLVNNASMNELTKNCFTDKLAPNGDNIGENSDNTSSGNTGGSGSAGGNTGENSGDIDGDNPDPFAPKPTRPGVVGGDDSGTGDDTGGSETGSEGGQSGGGTGSDSNSTHGGGGSGNGNNEHADGNGTESGILDELKAFHDENINAAPANGDDIMKIDGKNHELNGEYNKKINDGFRDAIADLNAKVETAESDIKEAISKIQNGFFQFNKETVTTCRVVKSFNVATRDIKIEYDFCFYLNKLYFIFYALSFAFVCFMGYKYILSRVFSFGGAE